MIEGHKVKFTRIDTEQLKLIAKNLNFKLDTHATNDQKQDQVPVRGGGVLKGTWTHKAQWRRWDKSKTGRKVMERETGVFPFVTMDYKYQ